MNQQLNRSLVQKTLLVLIFLFLIGAGVSLYQTISFFDLRFGEAGFKSICNLGGKINCEIVEASRFAELFPGLPLSAFAMSWFLGEAVLALIGYLSASPGPWISLLSVTTAVGGIFSVVYLGIMAGIIQAFCLFCLGVDVLNWTALAAVFLVLKPKRTELNFKTLAIVGALTGVGGLLISKAVQGERGNFSKNDIQDIVDSWANSAPVAVDTQSPDVLSSGPEDAPITVVKFSDIQCPHCQKGAFSLHPAWEMFKKHVRFVYKNFPLDASCNPHGGGHDTACEASMTLICAQQQIGKPGAFIPLYEQYFQDQHTLKPGVPLQMAKDLKFDVEKIKACVADPATKERVSKDIEEGIKLGVRSTPTFFINGKKWEGALPTPAWKAIFEKILADKNQK